MTIELCRLDLKPIEREDSSTVNQTVQNFLSDVAEHSNTGEDTITVVSKMISTLANLMSDRSSVMKKYNELFNEWRSQLLKEKLPNENISELHFIYCSAHVLLGFHTAVDTALKDGQTMDESLAVHTIRIVCELFGPRGDEKNGRRQDWLAYMNVVDKKSTIPLYRANRFNNVFSGAVAVYSHLDDIKTFISEYVQNVNFKLRNALSNLQNESILMEIRAIVILSAVITEPFWTMINSETVSHFDLTNYFRPMQASLKQWSRDSDELLQADNPPLFPDYPHTIYDALYDNLDNVRPDM